MWVGRSDAHVDVGRSDVGVDDGSVIWWHIFRSVGIRSLAMLIDHLNVAKTIINLRKMLWKDQVQVKYVPNCKKFFKLMNM